MTASDPDEVQTLLQNAITALKRGDKTTARSLAERAAALAPGSEEPWLVLAAVATSPGQSLAYIKRALQLNPESIPAQQALELTLKKQREGLQAPPPSKPSAPIRRTPLPVSSQKTASPAANRVVPMETSSQPKSYAGEIPPGASPDILGDTAPHRSQARSTSTGRKNFSFSPTLILGLFLLGVLVFSGLLALFFGEKLLGGISQVVQPLQPAPTFPTTAVPTPDCRLPTLVLGSTTYQIQTLAPAPDGSLSVPSEPAGIAYWVEGTKSKYVFVLSPESTNLTLQGTLQNGDIATIFWEDCSVASFEVSGIEAGQLSDPAFLDQSNPGLSVFIQTDPSTAGIVIKGELPEETISVPDTPMPDESGIFAEVSLLDITSSLDGTIQIDISIRNYGQTAFMVSANNITLMSEGSPAIMLTDSEPRLPREIKPGAVGTFTFTFPRPSSQVATLKVFTVEYDIEGY